MYPRATSHVINAITALITSRAMFAFIDDPEGPNLLIVTVLALIIYFASLSAHLILKNSSYLRKTLLALLIQIILASNIYFFLT
jgi:hypothetical protein